MKSTIKYKSTDHTHITIEKVDPESYARVKNDDGFEIIVTIAGEDEGKKGDYYARIAIGECVAFCKEHLVTKMSDWEITDVMSEAFKTVNTKISQAAKSSGNVNKTTYNMTIILEVYYDGVRYYGDNEYIGSKSHNREYDFLEDDYHFTQEDYNRYIGSEYPE